MKKGFTKAKIVGFRERGRCGISECVTILDDATTEPARFSRRGHLAVDAGPSDLPG
jgi:hypothetical protein